MMKLDKRPPKPPGFRYSCTACGSLEAGKPHKSWICRLMNRNAIVGVEDEMVFDEKKWKWVYACEASQHTAGH